LFNLTDSKRHAEKTPKRKKPVKKTIKPKLRPMTIADNEHRVMPAIKLKNPHKKFTSADE
jgi:hypothetical protein